MFRRTAPSGRSDVHREDEPVQPGIWLPSLVFDEPGEWNLTVALGDDDGAVEIPYGPVEVYANAADAAGAEGGEATAGVTFSLRRSFAPSATVCSQP